VGSANALAAGERAGVRAGVRAAPRRMAARDLRIHSGHARAAKQQFFLCCAGQQERDEGVALFSRRPRRRALSHQRRRESSDVNSQLARHGADIDQLSDHSELVHEELLDKREAKRASQIHLEAWENISLGVGSVWCVHFHEGNHST
jgi:hypothetical protein